MERAGWAGDRYVRRKVLGEGGAGRVWLVDDRLRPGPPVALKEIHRPGTPVDAASEAALAREFALLSSLRHPGLAEAYELDLDPETARPRFSQEWIEGRTILDAIQQEGPGSLTGFAAEALRTLRLVHEFGLIHRDIKPDNLLVREQPKLGYRLVLVDFGLATGPASEPLEALQLRGTLPYLAPELFDNEPAGVASDLYALGAVLYEAIHGHPPYVPDPAQLGRFIDAAREGRRSRPPLPDGYPEGLSEWLDAMLAPRPGDRPRDADDALDRLNANCAARHPRDTDADRTARLLSGPPPAREEAIESLRAELRRPDGAHVTFLVGPIGSGKARLQRWLYTEAIQHGWHARLGAGEDGSAEKHLWLIEDSQELDEPGARQIERLAWARKPGARAVVAVDPNLEPHPRLAELLRRVTDLGALRRLDLGPLDTTALRRLAERAQGEPVAAERVRRLAERSGGRLDVAETLLIDRDWDASSGPHAGLGKRVGLLSRSTRDWLETLAVLGDDVEDRCLRELTGADAVTTASAEQEALCAGVAWRYSGRWRMPPQLRAWVRDDLSETRRRELHERALETLEPPRDDARELARLARLHAETGDRQHAIEFASLAADALERAGDPTAAARQWGRALRFLGREREGRAALRIRQSEAWMRAGQAHAAVRGFSAAQRWAEFPADRLHALARRALARVRAGQFNVALEEAERITHRALAAGAPEQLALARRVAGLALARSGREQEALPLLDDAYEMLERLDDRAGQAALLHARANCRLRLGRDDAEPDFQAALDLYTRARENGQPDDAAELKTRIGLAVVQTRNGRLEEADETLARAGAAAEQGGQLDLQQVALSRRAVVALERGALDRAIELAAEAADLSAHLGDLDRVLVNRCHGADARIRCGRAAEAVTELRELLDGPLDRAEPQNVDYARLVLADALMHSGRGEDDHVRDLLDGCRRRARRRGIARPYLFSLVLELERRARPGCADAFDAAWNEYASVADDTGEGVDAEIAVRAQLARAAHALLAGRHTVVEEATTTAVARADGPAADTYRAQACALRAQAYDRQGREAEAREQSAEGRACLEAAMDRIEHEEARADFQAQPQWAALAEGDSLTSRDNHARLLALYDMLRILNSSTDPDTLLESILDQALEALGAERGMILLKQAHDRDPDSFTVHLARNLDTDTMDDVRSYSRRIAAAAATGQSLLALDAGTDERFQDFRSVSLYGIRSLMCVPLRSRDRIIGTVYLDSRTGGRLFTQDDLRFLEAFADQAALALGNVMDRVELEQANRRLQALAETRTSYHNLVGRCAEMQRVFDTIEKFAATDLPVLIHGESGTGKEIVARAIHFNGPRRKRAFVSENCAALPETLLESELFGHVRGAFTGAERDHPGLFEQAHRGTLFLDEIGDMSAAMQARLLRVLEEGQVRRVGGEQSIEVDVRVLAATHRDLQAGVEQGRFREDLFYRLQVLQVALPPLRDRPGDVDLLCDHFLQRIASDRELPALKVTPEVRTMLQRHTWPGNVRELENTLQRLVVLASGESIDTAVIGSDSDLRQRLGGETPRAAESRFSLDAGEREQLRGALEAAGGNRSAAARLLKISRATLYRKLRRHDL